MAENIEDLRRRSALLWENGAARPTRGPKRTLSAEDVVQAAIGIADREGLAALTMQSVARELGFTTMALYRYFPNKDALIDAIVDAAMGTPPERTGPKREWRDEVSRWAHAKRAMLMSRPWLAELPFVAAPHGPNWLSWLEGAVEALSLTRLGAVDVFDMLHVLDGYVRGGSDTSISLAKARARGMSDEEWGASVAADLMRAIGDPRYPVLSTLLVTGRERPGALTSSGLMAALDEGFDNGLQRVLDGIQSYIESRPTAQGRRTRTATARRRAPR
ncbi:MAG: TetR/AcrR family transcriptional regulator [Gemmatimonadaceae bacterium]